MVQFWKQAGALAPSGFRLACKITQCQIERNHGRQYDQEDIVDEVADSGTHNLREVNNDQIAAAATTGSTLACGQFSSPLGRIIGMASPAFGFALKAVYGHLNNLCIAFAASLIDIRWHMDWVAGNPECS